LKAIKKKICLLGVYGSGKTSIIDQYVNHKFEENYTSTLGVNISHKEIKFLSPEEKKDYEVNLIIWDIEGEEQSREVPSEYYVGSDGAIIVADLLRKDSIEMMPKLIEKFCNFSKNNKIVLVGNKVDLVDTGENEEFIKNIAVKNNLPYILTSAKTAKSIEECFNLLVQQILD